MCANVRVTRPFRALKAEEGSAFGAWLFMVLTAARPSGALEARWAEVDIDRRLWTLPPERMKNAKRHVVPLSTAALAVLDRRQRDRTGDAVFPGRSGSPLSYASFATAPAKAGIDACTPHGWRSCFRDWCGDIGDVPRDLAEAALAHSLNATEGAYRRMTAVERRREVMTRYADWLNDERGKDPRLPYRHDRLILAVGRATRHRGEIRLIHDPGFGWLGRMSAQHLPTPRQRLASEKRSGSPPKHGPLTAR
jgi:hypothetical protein